MGDNKKSYQYKKFYDMQCGDKYGDQTRVINSVQNVIVGKTGDMYDLEKGNERWYQKDFRDNTFEKRYVGDFEFYKRLNRNFNNIQEQVIRFNDEDN
jgi:hypothetical protein